MDFDHIHPSTHLHIPPTEANSTCQQTQGYGAMHRNKADPPGTTPLEKTGPPCEHHFPAALRWVCCLRWGSQSPPSSMLELDSAE